MHKPSSALGLALLIVSLLALALSHEPLSAQAPGSFFYYYEGARVPLTADRRVALRFRPDISVAGRRQVVAASSDLESYDASIQSSPLNLALVPLRPGHDLLAAASSLRVNPALESAAPVFSFPDGSLYAETDEFIVKYKASLSPDAIAQFNAAQKAVIARPQPYSTGIYILRPAAGSSRGARELANAFVESGRVDFAEPNFAIFQPQPQFASNASPSVSALAVPAPNDPLFPNQWGLQNTGQFQHSLAGADINALNAWDWTKGSAAPPVMIAIIDEGVKSDHPDLAKNLVPGINVTVQPNTTDTNPAPNDYHGTAAAGIAAADTDNGVGIAGVCWDCKIMPVKVATESSNGAWNTTIDQLVAGILWAFQNGANVLSNSWTMSGPSDSVKTAIIYANTAGSTVVFSAGNQQSGIAFPGTLRKYVVTVGASNWCDQLKTKANNDCNDHQTWWGSNYGPALDVIAPGMDIMTTCNGSSCSNGLYTSTFGGTSASAPFVAGVAGLMYSLNSSLDPDDIEAALKNGAVLLPPDPVTGTRYRRLDANGALAAMYDLTLTGALDRQLVSDGDTVTATLSYTNTGLTPVSSAALTVTLSPAFQYVSSNPAFSDLGGGVFRLDLGKLSRGYRSSATFAASALQGAGVPDLAAQIAAPVPELDLSDNSVDLPALFIKTNLFLPWITR